MSSKFQTFCLQENLLYAVSNDTVYLTHSWLKQWQTSEYDQDHSPISALFSVYATHWVPCSWKEQCFLYLHRNCMVKLIYWMSKIVFCYYQLFHHFVLLMNKICIIVIRNDASMQDMDALVCRRTLTGHTHDVLSITGLDFCPQLRAQNGHYQNGHNQNGDQLHSSDSFQFESPTSLFASASSDETLRIWDAKDWTCLRIIIIGDNPIKKVHPGFLSAFLTSRWERFNSIHFTWNCTIQSWRREKRGSDTLTSGVKSRTF